jgi:hypothetical protein
MSTIVAALTSVSDMANIEVGWEVEGIITAQESVSAMIKVIGTAKISWHC